MNIYNILPSSNLVFYEFAKMQYTDQQLNHKLEKCFYKDMTFQTDITECSNAAVQCFSKWYMHTFSCQSYFVDNFKLINDE